MSDERHPADARDLDAVGDAPNSAAIVAIRDVLLFVTGTDVTADDRAHPYAGEPAVEISRGARLERLPYEENELVMNACMPRGHFFFPVRQFGSMQALVFAVSEQQFRATRYGWDPDGALHAALVLSRLIVDHGHSTEWAARIVDHEDGEQQVIPFEGFDSRLAYRFDPTRRDWLDEPEAHALRGLLEIYWRDREELPDRLGQALRSGEDAVRQHYLERSLPLIVTGLEALLNTRKTELSKQFSIRVPALARELGITGVTRRMARRLYDARSQSSHGQRIALFEPWSPSPGRQRRTLDRSEDQRRVLAHVGLLQRVLREAVRRGIEDLDFRAALATPAATRARWPVGASDGSAWL